MDIRKFSSVMNGGAMLVTRAVAMHHRFDATNKSKASKSCCCIATQIDATKSKVSSKLSQMLQGCHYKSSLHLQHRRCQLKAKLQRSHPNPNPNLLYLFGFCCWLSCFVCPCCLWSKLSLLCLPWSKLLFVAEASSSVFPFPFLQLESSLEGGIHLLSPPPLVSVCMHFLLLWFAAVSLLFRRLFLFRSGDCGSVSPWEIP